MDCRILTLTTYLLPQNPPSRIQNAFNNVQPGSEWFCVWCDYALPQTHYADKETTCNYIIQANEENSQSVCPITYADKTLTVADKSIFDNDIIS